MNKMIDKATEDIYKQLNAKGIIRWQDKEDLRQSVTLIYFELLRKKGKEPLPGYLYKNAYFRCLDLFASTKRASRLARVDYIDFAEFVSLDTLSDPSEQYLDKEATQNSDALLSCLDQLYQLGVDISGQLGIIFALWWIGMDEDVIGLTLASAGLRPTKRLRIERHLKKIFNEIFYKTGLYPEQIQKARLSYQWCIL